MRPEDWPQLNASLNGTCAVLLVAGYVAIRCGRVTLHKGCMVTALLVSVLFLTSYLCYHISKGKPTPFGGTDEMRIVYYTVLLTHTVLAAVTAPLALFTAYQGYCGNLQRHVRVARWTLPIWLYVSVTGVVVYLLLRPYYNAVIEG